MSKFRAFLKTNWSEEIRTRIGDELIPIDSSMLNEVNFPLILTNRRCQ